MFNLQSFMVQLYRTITSLILVFILSLGYPSTALAQNNNPFQVALEGIKSLFVPRTKQGTPVGRVRGGAGRGRCPAIASVGDFETPLTALVPTISKSLNKIEDLPKSEFSDIVWGKTIEAYPTFWFYIPYVYEESELEYAKFVLLDEDKHIVNGPIFVQLPYKASLDDKPIIAKFTLPENQPLEINKQYNWYFSILCDMRKPSRNPSVSGWIQRVTLPIPAPKNYLYYAQSGIWYDMVTRLADGRAATLEVVSEIAPDNNVKSLEVSQNQIQKDWVELFNYLQLSDQKTVNQIADAPIVELLSVSESEVQ